MFASELATKITSILMSCGRVLYDMQNDAQVFFLIQRLLTDLGLDPQNVSRRWLEVYELKARNLVHYSKVLLKVGL